MRSFRRMSILATLVAAFPAAAQPTAPQEPATDWNPGFQANRCTVSITDRDGVTFSLWMLPGDPSPHLSLVGPRKLVPRPEDRATVQLQPSGEKFPTVGSVVSVADPTAIMLINLGHRFPAAFATSNEVRVAANGKQIAIPVPGSEKAMGMLQQCIDKKLPEWGVDAQAYDSLQVPALNIDGRAFMSGSDLPADAVTLPRISNAIIRLNVDATGKVTKCAVVVSTGSKATDDATCSSAIRSGWLKPAIGGDGKPTAAVRMQEVVFLLL
jgi:hypothetical protein